MQVTVKLYGTLGKRIPGYVHSEGLLVKIPDDCKVKDLLSLLNIPESQSVSIAMEGRILNRDDELRDDVCVNVLEPLHGG
jgi:sulfur carrier protein ThiS